VAGQFALFAFLRSGEVNTRIVVSSKILPYLISDSTCHVILIYFNTVVWIPVLPPEFSGPSST
jgi:hypothetical protein